MTKREKDVYYYLIVDASVFLLPGYIASSFLETFCIFYIRTPLHIIGQGMMVKGKKIASGLTPAWARGSLWIR